MKEKYWVTMTDKFMSGWGKANEKTNKLVLVCDTSVEAGIVAQNARNRPEMKYVNIRTTKPWYSPRRFYVSWHSKEDYGSWYVLGYFPHMKP